MSIKSLTPPDRQPPPRETRLIRASLLARLLGVAIAAILLAAIGAAAIVGLITFTVFFLLLVPVLLALLVAAAIFGRGRFKIYVYRRPGTSHQQAGSPSGQIRNP
jgi:hypothetical protein